MSRKREVKRLRKESDKSEGKEKGKEEIDITMRGRHIIREVIIENWEHTGYQGEGRNIKKVFTCKICGSGGIRGDNRKVHACLNDQ